MRIFDQNFTVLEKGLDAYSDRAKALANNIANVNTPHYKRQDIQFEEILEEALSENSPKIEGVKTDKNHMKINKIPDIETMKHNIVTEEETFMRNDGNNVDIEREQSEFAKNNIRYQFGVNRISQNFGILKAVIKGK